MAKTSAQRQQEYRSRRPYHGDGDYRLNTWVSTSAHLGLGRLATHYGLTQRAMLERLVEEADNEIRRSLTDDDHEWDRYMGRGDLPPQREASEQPCVPGDELVTLQEATKIVGRPKAELYLAIACGSLFAVKGIGKPKNRWSIAQGDLMAWQERERNKRPEVEPAQGTFQFLAGYTKRERLVLEWLGKGCKPQDIADFLGSSLSSIKGHCSNIYGKLGVSKRSEAVLAIQALPCPTQPLNPPKKLILTGALATAVRARLASGERRAAVAAELGMTMGALKRLLGGCEAAK